MADPANERGEAPGLSILIVSPKLPFPPTDGGRIAIFEPIRFLAARGHRVTLLSLAGGDDTEARAGLAPYCEVQVVRHDTRTRPLHAALNLFSPLPYTVSKYRSEPMRRELEALLRGRHFDLVQVEQLHMVHYCETARAMGVPVVLRQHNVESILARRFANEARGVWRLYAEMQARKLRRFEAAGCARADTCLAISEPDAAELAALAPTARMGILPAGVDVQAFAPQPEERVEPASIVSVASMDWLPNVDSIHWFCEEVLPRVAARVPQARLTIVGKDPHPSIRRLEARGGIEVTGFVPDTRDYIARAAVFIVPLRVGSGMRLKILQAMSMGKAVVSTTLGAQGIEVTDGRNILLADTAEAFAGSVAALLLDPEQRRELARNARSLAERRYAWESIAREAERIYAGLLRPQPRA